ncbi:Fe(3+) ions import ATP-binding protein FbpC [Hartmannibacter diazotrophicus]|uniref:Fe(3+) ions import ATP-binding protein FbpC n=1 Tax=Hartmannibacter diazotrophicus TaxID=1482074 RepID=A0A2C9D9Q3_9HYPH|nr:molybdenum ABC transporter ATP-binding protein [Hartmannibacter diazotrophicus]SON56900.1 Fe(3+) ions import ATP-binding protein FbpC [Hartmannibacter diazotrophicus]
MIEARFSGVQGQFSLDVAFEVPGQGITALFGPSGCGKTTVLRCIAGLNHMREGRCVIDGDVWQDAKTFLPVHRRPIGYVFQEASLFPHLSVRRNLLYGAPKTKGTRASASIGFDDVVELLGLARLVDRSTHKLSGGERQRVAIGRALLSEPRLLLMDEPLSALDRQTKDEILPFLERLHGRLGIPALYVSHDISEVERLADHLVLMDKGRVVAAGPYDALQRDPALPLALRRDAAVTLEAKITSHEATDGLATLSVAGGRFLMPAPADLVGQTRRLRIAAGDVSLARQRPTESTILNVMQVRILSVTPAGDNEVVAVLGLGEDGEGARILARVTRRSWQRLGFAEGMTVHAQVKGVALAPS